MGPDGLTNCGEAHAGQEKMGFAILVGQWKARDIVAVHLTHHEGQNTYLNLAEITAPSW